MGNKICHYYLHILHPYIWGLNNLRWRRWKGKAIHPYTSFCDTNSRHIILSTYKPTFMNKQFILLIFYIVHSIMFVAWYWHICHPSDWKLFSEGALACKHTFIWMGSEEQALFCLISSLLALRHHELLGTVEAFHKVSIPKACLFCWTELGLLEAWFSSDSTATRSDIRLRAGFRPPGQSFKAPQQKASRGVMHIQRATVKVLLT